MSTQPVPRNVEYQSIGDKDYVILGPGGALIKIPAALYEALAMFIGAQGDVKDGTVTVACNRGGVAAVSVNIKLK